MDLLLAGLVGALVGALIVAAAMLTLLQKRADRDLIERRLRACNEYRECLGDLRLVLDRQGDEPAVVEQAWRNVALFCREYRLTGWLFERAFRRRLDAIVGALEVAEGLRRADGTLAAGRAAQLLCEQYHRVDRLLGRELERQRREHRRFRFLPDAASIDGHSGGDDAD